MTQKQPAALKGLPGIMTPCRSFSGAAFTTYKLPQEVPLPRQYNLGQGSCEPYDLGELPAPRKFC